jgi:hypothetical protein
VVASRTPWTAPPAFICWHRGCLGNTARKCVFLAPRTNVTLSAVRGRARSRQPHRGAGAGRHRPPAPRRPRRRLPRPGHRIAAMCCRAAARGSGPTCHAMVLWSGPARVVIVCGRTVLIFLFRLRLQKNATPYFHIQLHRVEGMASTAQYISKGGY